MPLQLQPLSNIKAAYRKYFHDRPVLLLGGMLLLVFPGLADSHDKHDEASAAVVLAPGYRVLEYSAPEPGSYELPVLFPATDGRLVTPDNRSVSLSELLGEKYVLLSFIYTSCNDVNGCPLATYVLGRVHRHITGDANLADRVRLVSISFDPAADSPAVMKQYAKTHNRHAADWHFLTTGSQRDMQALLQGFNQSVIRETDEQGNITSTISHILRVFLLDLAGNVRNIYSVSFLHADTIINDIRTLELATGHDTANRAVVPTARHQGPGDDRTGYENGSYVTRSRSLAERKGQALDLFRNVEKPPTGLGPVPVPPDNAVSRAKIDLGRMLFFDRRLSYNNTFSCAMCHIPEQGFTSNELATAIGVEGRTVRRNAPTLYNVAYARTLFHDAREQTLEQQVWSPLLARNEMANPSVGHVIGKITAIPGYLEKFMQAFGGKGPTMETVGMALASYERTLVSADSPFDRWYYAADGQAMSVQAISGFRLFSGKARCAHCHTIGRKAAYFSDQKLHNTGIGYKASMSKQAPIQDITIAPGLRLQVDSAVIADAAETPQGDLGYYEISGDPADRWKYRTPTLRNISLTAPYMHDGSLATLRQVVDFYNRGGAHNELLDPVIKPLQLDQAEIGALLAFLASLTGANVDALVSDAFAQRTGNTP